jgi:hypothetical protein
VNVTHDFERGFAALIDFPKYLGRLRPATHSPGGFPGRALITKLLRCFRSKAVSFKASTVEIRNIPLFAWPPNGPGPNPSSLACASLLIARIHKGSPPALGAQIGIVDWGPALVGAEPAHQFGIGLEFGRPSIELPGMAKQHSGTPVHGLHNPAHLHIHIAIFQQLAYLVAILPEADDGEAAGFIGGLGRADVEVAGSVGQLHHVINVGRHADILVEQFGGFVSGNARLRFPGHSS